MYVLEEMAMIDYAAILKKNPNGVLVTQDRQAVRTRMFQYLFADGKTMPTA